MNETTTFTNRTSFIIFYLPTLTIFLIAAIYNFTLGETTTGITCTLIFFAAIIYRIITN